MSVPPDPSLPPTAAEPQTQAGNERAYHPQAQRWAEMLLRPHSDSGQSWVQTSSVLTPSPVLSSIDPPTYPCLYQAGAFVGSAP